MVLTSSLEYRDDDGTVFEGFLAQPEGDTDRLPGVVIFPSFAGCSDFEKEKAVLLAELGYVALAADPYGKGVTGTTKEECFALMKPLIEARTTTLQNRLRASLEALKGVERVDKTKARLAAMGYCFGGLCALDIARSNALGVVACISFHGTLTPLPGAEIEKIRATVAVHHGDIDTHVNEQVPAFQQEMRDRQADWQFTNYGNAAHAFTKPGAEKLGVPSVAYNKEAAVRSWAATVALLAEKLH